MLQNLRQNTTFLSERKKINLLLQMVSVTIYENGQPNKSSLMRMEQESQKKTEIHNSNQQNSIVTRV